MTIGKTNFWRNRFNLAGKTTLFFYIKDAGSYVIRTTGAAARYRLEPYFTSTPDNYQPPPFRGDGSKWDIDKGYYVLTIEPDSMGIVEAAVIPESFSAFAWDAPTPPEFSQALRRGSVRFPSLNFEKTNYYFIVLNERPGLKSGIIARKLPLDLTRAVPLTQSPLESVVVGIEAAENGVLQALTESGVLLEMQIDNGPWQQSPAVTPGNHTATVRYAGEGTAVYSLFMIPASQQAAAALPSMSKEALAKIPQLPSLTFSQPQFFDLERNGSRTFLLQVADPGLYKLQTTGLLATKGSIRTRTTANIFTESNNGVGRNFLIQQYLRSGEYQVTVAPQGKSAGHAGLELARTELVNGGELLPEIPARISLPAGSAVHYQFVIKEAANYHLKSFGINGVYKCRLEDDGGWPVVEPNKDTDFDQKLLAGTYQLILLPTAVETSRITLLSKAEKPPRLEGHGPHQLPIGITKEGQWREPTGDAARQPDIWQLDVPAPIDASINLTQEMKADLKRQTKDGAWVDVGSVLPAKAWKGLLETGSYRLEAVCSRKNDWVTYQVYVTSDELVDGMERTYDVPVSIPVSIGKAGLMELASFGSDDVRARLYDEQGKLIAAGDDRPNDWNFRLTAVLNTGAYHLDVEPMGKQKARCSVSLKSRQEVVQPAAAIPFTKDITLAHDVLVYPLTLQGKGMLLAAARSQLELGLALEFQPQAAGSAWSTIGSAQGKDAVLELPLAAEPAGAYRLRVWSGEWQGATAKLTLLIAEPKPLAESSLQKGVQLAPVAGFEPPVGIAAIALDHPGTLRLKANSGSQTLRWSSMSGTVCRNQKGDLVSAGGATLWLAADVGSSLAARTITANRVSTPAGADAQLQLALPPETSVLVDLGSTVMGPMVVLASSMTGQPGLRLAEQGEKQSLARDATTMAAGDRSAAAVMLTHKAPVAVLWNASREVSSPLDVKLQHLDFPPVTSTDLKVGHTAGSISGIAAQSFSLPAGEKYVKLTVGDSCLAAFTDKGTLLGIHWCDGKPFTVEVETAASQLIIFHTVKGNDQYALDVLPSAAGTVAAAVTPEQPFEQLLPAAGWLSLDVTTGATAASPLVVHVAGAAEKPRLQTSDGWVLSGDELTLTAAKVRVCLSHGPGLVSCWLDPPASPGKGLWGKLEPGQLSPLAPPAMMPLKGAAERFKLELGHAALLHAELPGFMAVRLVQDQNPSAHVLTAPTAGDYYLPAGKAELWLRALAGGTLHGNAAFTVGEVPALKEGLGPELVIAPGASQAFSFVIAKESDAGIGIRAEGGSAECTLMDSQGTVLGEGLLQMPHLKPATYILKVAVPPGEQPVRIRPAIVGLEPPGAGPPKEMIAEYLKQIGGGVKP